MPRLRIDGQDVEVEAGATVLDAARKLGIEIPTLCWKEGHERFTSCMLCVVRDVEFGKLLPSCSALAQDHMEIETRTAPVVEARRQALELLLSDHVGDCEGPCQRACPAHMNIPLMIRQIASSRMAEALVTVKRHIALPAVLGRICPAPCEKICRRGRHDAPVGICLLKRHTADVDLSGGSPWTPTCAAASGKKVAIVGSGPAGLSAAYYLLEFGHACVVFDAREAPGGELRRGVPEAELPRDVLDAEIASLRRMGAEFRLSADVGAGDLPFDGLANGFDAVILAVGPPELSDLARFGVALTPRGIKVKADTFETSRRGTFAGGAAIGAPKKLAVRSVGDGRGMAVAAHQFLAGQPVTGAVKRFNSVVSRVDEAELGQLRVGASALPPVAPAGGNAAGYMHEEAVQEANRCLHCDCRKPESCRLRRYAGEYDARQAHYRSPERKPLVVVRQHADVLFEPGKCILCGLCVRITRSRSERLGLSFVGRGFETRVGVPFGESLAEGLKETARECVEACPTGALSFSIGVEESDRCGS